MTEGAPLASGDTNPPSPSVLPRPVPVECDVCGGELHGLSEYASMVVVTDSTPRSLREARGAGYIENEWRLDAVCLECFGKFETWLLGEQLSERHEAITIPAPPPLAVDSSELESEPPNSEPGDFERELAPLCVPAPNHS